MPDTHRRGSDAPSLDSPGNPPGASSIAALTHRALDTIRVLPGGSLAIRIVTNIIRGGVTDRSMTLAAQAFTSILPIVILLTTLPGMSIIDTALNNLGLSREQLDIADTSTESVATFGIFGALMTIAGATSLSRALGRMYVAIWEVRKLPWTSWWRWVVVIVVIPIAAAVQGLAVELDSFSLLGITVFGRGPLGSALEILLTFLIWTALWILVPRLLVSKQVPLGLLTLNGVVTGVFVTILLIGSALAMPRIVASTTAHYGTLGVVFVAISWLFVFAAILVITALIVAAVTADDGRIGTWIRRRAGSPQPFPDPRGPRIAEPEPEPI